MKYHFCVICYAPVRHPQQTTCGAAECRDSWKHLGRDARARHMNLATMSPSERAYCLSQGPAPEEAQQRLASQQVLDDELAEYEQQQAKKATPAFIRTMLDPANAPISTPQPSEKEEE